MFRSIEEALVALTISMAPASNWLLILIDMVCPWLVNERRAWCAREAP